MRIIDAIQIEQPAAQIAGMACVFTLLAARLGVHAGDAMEVAARILSDKKRKTDLQAVELYMENEIKK